MYEGIYIFQNDFPALLKSGPEPPGKFIFTMDNGISYFILVVDDGSELFKLSPAFGECKVICYHPRSDLTLAKMSHADVLRVIEAWIGEFTALGQKHTWVQLFENKGAMMGCSNPHPHCQVWASSFLPTEIATKDRTQREYLKKHGIPMLVKYVHSEIERKERIVAQNATWVALVPFWAVWPFETMLIPKRHVIRFGDLTAEEKSGMGLFLFTNYLFLSLVYLFRFICDNEMSVGQI